MLNINFKQGFKFGDKGSHKLGSRRLWIDLQQHNEQVLANIFWENPSRCWHTATQIKENLSSLKGNLKFEAEEPGN